MDALAALLDGPRARGAFLLRSMLTPPWSMRIEDQAPVSVIAVVRGHAWILPATAPAVHLGMGDVAIAKGPDPYTVCDDPASPPSIVIHAGQICTTIDGTDLSQTMDLGVRTWGNDPDGDTVMLTGTYETAGEISRRLLTALPPLLVLPADAWQSHLIPLLREEIVKDDPGQEAVLDRLLDLLLIAVLRTWFARPDTPTPAWYRARSDPIAGPALRLLENNPAHPWTIESLALEIGISRAALARRFTTHVGEPPMTYLTNWRLSLAADLLLENPNTTLESIATKVGYTTPFALSAAFKRVRGVSPQDYRQANS
ncbi:AraC family transcriptional regulator [Nocardia sp. alder85J]|uniref:AraC family transcriptional regulator n=1 Tax=Nocardia sp. alder85J TaxID=2862949 RepID=UPI001CD5815F|nr:AraC family transcriptional regulator [Nocardia sp. alder85J]MCX4099021.1 AraC family transcriptional regulator [Nocardia sp. alder85J]